MNDWVLIIALLSPGGDYIDKIPVQQPSEKSCQIAKRNLPKRGEDPMGLQFRGVCVTMDHWTGKRPMKNVPLD